ncbi:MAG TPA: hypothetical protein VFX59_08335 [Polyangiales bacterium]|nr:hypothetical protein [Polyangiales bacterium]
MRDGGQEAGPGLAPSEQVKRDAATADAASRQDAGSAVTPFSCKSLQPEPAFCDEFEQVGLLSRWDFHVVNPPSAGVVDIDESSALSGKGSLLAVINANVTDACLDCAAFVGRTLEPLAGPSRIRVDVDLRLEQIDSVLGRGITVFRFGFVDANGEVSAHVLDVVSTGANAVSYFTEYLSTDLASADGSSEAPEPAINRWVHLRYQLDVNTPSGTGNSASLWLDTTEVFAGTLTHALLSNTPFVELGVPGLDSYTVDAANPNQSWRVRFDNFVVRVEPL